MAFFPKFFEGLLLFGQMFLKPCNMIFTFQKMEYKLPKLKHIFIKTITFQTWKSCLPEWPLCLNIGTHFVKNEN